MAPRSVSDIVVDFDFFRFNGKGASPSIVPAPEQANFLRSRYSVPEQLLELAAQRVQTWAHDRGVSVSPKTPFPSNQAGKYWLEYRIGGLSL